jgi:hypothetical protein
MLIVIKIYLVKYLLIYQINFIKYINLDRNIITNNDFYTLPYNNT